MCGGVIKPKTAAKWSNAPKLRAKRGCHKTKLPCDKHYRKKLFYLYAKSEKTKTAKISDKIERKINFEIIKPVV